MRELQWMARVAVLWILLAVGMSAAMILALLEPGVIDDVRAGEVGGMELSDAITVLFAVFWLIPLAMAFLTLALRDRANRWSNGVVGLLMAAMYAVDTVEHLVDGAFGGEALMMLAGILVAAIIVWHAWKWPMASRATARPSGAPIRPAEPEAGLAGA